MEYRKVAEKKLGRALKSQEVVHHIDGDRTNNDPDNLQVFPSSGMHVSHHSTLRKREIAHDLEQIERDDWLSCWYDLEAPFSSEVRHLRAHGLDGIALGHARDIIVIVRGKLVTFYWGLNMRSKWAELAQQHEKTFLVVVDKYIAHLRASGQAQPWKIIPRILREVSGQ